MRVDEFRALGAACCCASAVLVLGSLLALTGWEPFAWLGTLAMVGAYAFGLEAESERMLRVSVQEARARLWLDAEAD